MRLRTIQALLLFISLLIATQCVLVQTNELQFNHLIGSNGITLGKINAITQDKLGFIWLSDQSNRCLVRCDGNHMKWFSYSQGKPNTLGGYYPECLATDPSGALWIGFYGQGLDRFDPYTNTFTHYSHSDDDPESLSNDVVSAVLFDHLGNLWVGTDGGLNLFDAATARFKHFKHDPADSTSLSHDMVRSIYEDRQGVLWVGTGIAFIPGDEGGLNRFDRNTGTFTRYMHEPGNPNSLVDFSQGMLYVGSSEPLEEGQFDLVKSLADSFSVAYARYEDFKQLEDAKNRVEATLTELRTTQSNSSNPKRWRALKNSPQYCS